MLVLSRKQNESILLGANVEIFIVDIRGDKVRLGIRAPDGISVHRKEIADAILREGKPLLDLAPQYVPMPRITDVVK